MNKDKYTILVLDDEVFGFDRVKKIFLEKGCVFMGALPEKGLEKLNEFHDKLLEETI